MEVNEITEVISSAKFIATHSESVSVCEKGIKRGAELILQNWPLGVKPSEDNYLEPLNLTEKETLEWIFLVDTLNFCFWTDDDCELFTAEFNGIKWTGYYSLCACLTRAVKEGIHIYKPSVFGNITLSQLQYIFRSCNNTEIPLIEKRLENLHEAAGVLSKKFNGDVTELVKAAEKSAQKLIHLLASHFPSYNDTGVYKNRTVSFLKRAQIFVSDTWSRFNGKSYGEFIDIDTLTMFPDYRVPQALLQIGALKYTDQLINTINEGKHLNPGSKEEMEIRGCSVWAIELICQEILSESLPSTEVLACQIDYFFWRYAKDSCHSQPCHKTLTIFY